MIILTVAQANQVRGLTVKGHALAPVALIDGTYCLPEACAQDAAHAEHHAFLRSLPTASVAPEDFLYYKLGDPDAGREPTIMQLESARLRAAEFSSAWPVGERVVTANGKI